MARATRRTTTPPDRSPLAAAARSLLQQRLEGVERTLRRVRPGPRRDLETVHDLRVAIRRAEAALKLFADWLPPRRSGKLRSRLRSIRQATGPARDLDVLQPELRRLEQELSPRLRELVQRRFSQDRQAAERLVHQVATAKSIQRLHATAERLLGKFDWRGAADEPAAIDLLLLRIERFARRLRKPRQLPRKNARLHRLRIRCRKLRYEAELLAALPVRVAKGLVPLIDALREVQDQLGAVQDAAVQRRRLKTWLQNLPEAAQVRRVIQPNDAAPRSRAARRRAQRLWSQVRALVARLGTSARREAGPRPTISG